jgi:HNH endonuclease
VITAYNGRCALSGLPEPLLLDAAHIIGDREEEFGQPVVPNGIPLSKIHHAAFDAHLIGIDPDYRLHVSERLLVQTDRPMLEALKRLDKGALHLPRRAKDQPDRERLALRFEQVRRGTALIRKRHTITKLVAIGKPVRDVPPRGAPDDSGIEVTLAVDQIVGNRSRDSGSIHGPRILIRYAQLHQNLSLSFRTTDSLIAAFGRGQQLQKRGLRVVVQDIGDAGRDQIHLTVNKDLGFPLAVCTAMAECAVRRD